MGRIKVIIQDHTGAKKTPVELPDDVPMKQLIPALVTKLGLPSQWHPQDWEHYRLFPEPITYKLHHKRADHFLGDEDTLVNIGVTEGDTLVLFFGLPEVPDLFDDLTAFSEKFGRQAVVVAFRFEDRVTALVLPKILPLSDLRPFIDYQQLCRGRGFGIPPLTSRPEFYLYNETTNRQVEEEGGAVSDVIRSGDVIRVEPRVTQRADETRPPVLIRLTREDLEGRHNP